MEYEEIAPIRRRGCCTRKEVRCHESICHMSGEWRTIGAAIVHLYCTWLKSRVWGLFITPCGAYCNTLGASGGMADAGDLKSPGRKVVRVRFPPRPVERTVSAWGGVRWHARRSEAFRSRSCKAGLGHLVVVWIAHLPGDLVLPIAPRMTGCVRSRARDRLMLSPVPVPGPTDREGRNACPC